MEIPDITQLSPTSPSLLAPLRVIASRLVQSICCGDPMNPQPKTKHSLMPVWMAPSLQGLIRVFVT